MMVIIIIIIIIIITHSTRHNKVVIRTFENSFQRQSGISKTKMDWHLGEDGAVASWWASGKKKCTLVQALRLCTGRTAYRGSRGIALPFHHHGTRRGWWVSLTPRPLFTPWKDPVPIVQEAGWDPGPVWTGAKNLVPTGIRSPDRPARSQSLYRLSYRANRLEKDLRNVCRSIKCLSQSCRYE